MTTNRGELMLRITIIIQLLFFNLSLLASSNEEFRSTWVITWEHINPDDTPEENMARVRAILDDHSSANMNAVLFQARQSGTAYYNSSYEPWGYYAGYEDPGYDPLAYAIEQAHARGLELHAWFNVFASASLHEGAPAAEHPEWICRDRSGNPMTENIALSPGLDSVREYLVSVAMEIIRNYDIDGLHLDYIRWNEYTNSTRSSDYAKWVRETRALDGMITQEQIEELSENPEGRYLYDIEHPYNGGIPDSAGGGQFPSWEDWWRWGVTEFVHVLHDSIQAVKPWIRLSVAALGRYNWGGWNGYGVVYQDAALWFNEGSIEQLSPMHYHWTTGNEFYGMLSGSCPNCWKQWIQEGITAGRLYSVGPGSYRLADYSVWNNHEEIVATCRTVPWVDGFQFFSYGTWKFYQYWEQAKELFFSTKTKIRSTGLIDSISPGPVTLDLTPFDSLTYQITVSPTDTGTTAHWYSIYRSEDANIDTSEDEIINIHFGDTAFSFTDSLSGTQDFNGQYHYAATSSDRFWNESPVSNVSVTDSIPSFPPVIISTFPLEGDTTAVNISLQITFSKTMDINSVNGAITLTPFVNIEQTLWTSNHKTLTISFDQNLENATTYTLVIDTLAVDVNGMQIDGNADGVGGDAFILHFTTEEVDIHGPFINQSYPDFASYSFNIDVEDVFYIVFDEIVDNATLNDTTILLSLLDNMVPIEFLHNVVQGRSVLSIRSVEPLHPDTEYSLTLSDNITDLLGNPISETLTTYFMTSPVQYSDITMIDDFTTVNNWWQPNQSGSTTGILAGTAFGSSTEIYLPVTSPHKSAKLSYVWDTSASEHLLREYLSGGPPRDVWFDTTYTLQCYLFGDGSNNKFRFCVDDHVPDAGAPYHEVSFWTTIDWVGWRLIEWDLGTDPVGTWIGNGLLEGTLRIDSFQLTHQIGGATEGAIYFDNLRLSKKFMVNIQDEENALPNNYVLHQNYPNPFNPNTTIVFSIPKSELVHLEIYDLLGRRVITLINEELPGGNHSIIWNGKNENGVPVSSGPYIYLMRTNKFVDKKRMLLLK